jgi:hypothetical protein
MDLIEHLRKEIKKSGYPLEIEISSRFSKNWDEIVNTDSYFDGDEGKMRDIDISAYRLFEFKTNKGGVLLFSANLVIECKKDENFTWVFFTRSLRSDRRDISGQYIDGVQILTKNAESDAIMELILENSRLHYSRMRKIAACFDEFYMRGNRRESHKKRDVFEATNQLKKYILYSNEQTLKSTYPYLIEFRFPCIVFDGKMFEAEVEGGKIKLYETKHVLLRTFHKASYSTWDLGFLIDIVHKSYFNKFLQTIENNIESVRRVTKNKMNTIFSTIADLEDLMIKREHKT